MAESYRNNPRQAVERNQLILDQALKYTIQISSPKIVKHLLMSAQNLLLTAMVTDEAILELVRDINSREKAKVLSLLVNYKVLIHYSNVETNKYENAVQLLRQKSLAQRLTDSNASNSQRVRSSVHIEENKVVEVDEKHWEDAWNLRNNNSPYEYTQILPERLMSNNSYLDKKH